MKAEMLRPFLIAALGFGAVTGAGAQELEPRTYAPSPVGMTFAIVNVGKSEGGILYDPSLSIGNVEADLWIATTGFGRTFALAGHQAKLLAIFPTAWGTIEGDVDGQPQRERLRGLVDPRIKVTIGLTGAPAMSPAVFASVPRRTATGLSLTVMPPIGQYDSDRLVNLGYNRWAFKPELGTSSALGRWTVDAYAGVWLFTTNKSYYPGNAERTQDPLLSLQGHVSYAVTPRVWVAFDGTWFAGGETQINGELKPDLQRNTRMGVTLSLPIARQQSIKLVYSTGTTTRRGSDFDTINATWQVVRF